MQHGFFTVDDQRVAGIVPALETDHGMHLLGQQIHHLALALITPLGTKYDNRLAHD